MTFLLCDPGAGTSHELDVQNEWEENTHHKLVFSKIYASFFGDAYARARLIGSIHYASITFSIFRDKEHRKKHILKRAMLGHIQDYYKHMCATIGVRRRITCIRCAKQGIKRSERVKRALPAA